MSIAHIQTSNLDIVHIARNSFVLSYQVSLARRRTKFEAKFSNFLSNKYK